MKWIMLCDAPVDSTVTLKSQKRLKVVKHVKNMTEVNIVGERGYKKVPNRFLVSIDKAPHGVTTYDPPATDMPTASYVGKR